MTPNCYLAVFYGYNKNNNSYNNNVGNKLLCALFCSKSFDSLFDVRSGNPVRVITLVGISLLCVVRGTSIGGTLLKHENILGNGGLICCGPLFFGLRLRFCMPSFFMESGRFMLCSLKYRPQALQTGFPSLLRRHKTVVPGGGCCSSLRGAICTYSAGECRCRWYSLTVSGSSESRWTLVPVLRPDICNIRMYVRL
ncbi:hypothetical protein FF38_05358 [Lucilia cuprina]|uniref:Uncharacterized protein n=1 Tax=Lucilia cuprina TaxID=7375 RepID=A0A0L0BNE7_LUCCU|nr:hypothetical protein FF38_05358 [Lucilia cuprina]